MAAAGSLDPAETRDAEWVSEKALKAGHLKFLCQEAEDTNHANMEDEMKMCKTQGNGVSYMFLSHVNNVMSW